MKKALLLIALFLLAIPIQALDEDPLAWPSDLFYRRWYPHRMTFGIETVTCRFPAKAIESKSDTLKTAQADADGIKYCMMGYFPPIGSIDAQTWFDQIRDRLNEYPYTCISFSGRKEADGRWVLDYEAHDNVLNEQVITRAYVTSYNAYTLQCRKPMGSTDDFSYFIDNCFIRCSES